MSKRKRRLLIPGSIALGLLLFIGINVALAVRNALSFPKYWQDKANEPVAPNAIRVAALGDSAMQAIGTANPGEGIAGRGGVGNSVGGFCQGIQRRGTPPGHLLVAIAALEQ